MGHGNRVNALRSQSTEKVVQSKPLIMSYLWDHFNSNVQLASIDKLVASGNIECASRVGYAVTLEWRLFWFSRHIYFVFWGTHILYRNWAKAFFYI